LNGCIAQSLRTVVEASASWLCGTFRGSLARGLPSPLYINLGSAYIAPAGWLNLDRTINIIIDRIPGLAHLLYRANLLSDGQYERFRDGMWRRTRYWDARYRIPVPDSSADAIYSSHLLEHLDLETARRLVVECHRILRPGGVIRLVVPDAYLISTTYASAIRRLSSGEVSSAELVDFLGIQVPAGQVSRHFVGEFYDPDPVRQQAFGHRWMYDRWSLRTALEESGFTQVRELPFQVGSVPNLDVLDCRPSNSLHMEGLKP
jgi:SAM-dependent methyltransferase